MSIAKTSLGVEDLVAVGSRVSWGAILAGAMLAWAIHILLSILGAAVGLSMSDRVTDAKLHTGAILWVVVTSCVALFVGGLITSLYTVGENKVEAVVSGVIMWAVLVALVLHQGAAGQRSGYSAMVQMSGASQVADGHASTTDAAEKRERATTLAWYAFAGTWLSMIAAAAGAFLGAGPTLRVVIVAPSNRGSGL